MNALKCFAIPAAALLLITSCKKNDNNTEAKINFVFKFDSTQLRLDNFGNPTSVPAGRSAQSPRFNSMSAHYVELAQNELTPLASGAVLYRAPETSVGGSNAIDFDKSVLKGDGETFLSVPIKSMAAGSYNWLRVSLAYQNYDIKFRSAGYDLSGTLASFIGFNSYVRNYKIKDSIQSINSNKPQGYWGFETSVPGFGGFVYSGQAPAGSTTVPNPLASTSPIPPGSCVVTGKFVTPLVITGNETSDVTVIVSLSTNKSFEWTDLNGNGIYEPADGDVVVDMGVRGLIPIKQ